jgi:cytochrome c5
MAVGLAAVGVLAARADGIKVDVSKLPPAAAKTGVTFDTDIKPMFEKSCAKCHGADVEKPKGKFRSDTKANILKGGGEGPAVTPGDLAKSPLIAMVAQVVDDDAKAIGESGKAPDTESDFLSDDPAKQPKSGQGGSRRPAT